MRTAVFSAILSLAGGLCHSQNVTHREHFLDSDNGFGQNTVVALAPGEDVTADITVNIPAGSSGFHRLYVRTKDSNGKWSHTARRNIQVVEPDAANNVLIGEYFLDSDPMAGGATAFAISPQSPDVVQEFIASIGANLPVGFHKLYGRVKDSRGSWSHTFRRNIQVTPADAQSDVVEVECFFGSDPEFGNAAFSVVFANPQPDGTWLINVPYPAGPYDFSNKLFIRARSNMGLWSHTTILDQADPNLLQVPAVSFRDAVLHPNPASSRLWIDTNQHIQRITVYDLGGRQCSVLSDTVAKSIDVSTLSVGTYLISIETETGVLRGKFLKR